MKTDKPIKKLNLTRETVRTLNPGELDQVAGGTLGIVSGASIAVSLVTSGTLYCRAVVSAVYSATKAA